MLIISKALSPLIKKALNRVAYEYGEGYGLKIMGAWVTLERNSIGEEIAIFYTSLFEDYFDLDKIEKSLKFYVGELEKPFFTPPIEVVRDPIMSWKDMQKEIISSLKEELILHGKNEAEATIEAMFLGSSFFEFNEGMKYKFADTAGIKNIIELALKKHKSIEIRIEKSDPNFLEKYITITILKTEE
ncbi:MAG: hypothetical protein N3A59_00375 [Thermodesulfovibrionales bacterium]|nr:hypothetical protein [Thermodesulfovibrionales bacterium]